MGMFDDLIPERSAPTAPPSGGGMFDDLIPKAGPQPDQGALAASTNAMGNALSFNFMDEAVAGAAAGIDSLGNLITGNDKGGTFGENYNRHLLSQRGQDVAAAAQHPTATTVGQIGAIATAAPKAVAGLAAPAMRAATVGERAINAGVGAAKGAGAGAAYSAASGFGAGEGGFDKRLASAEEAAPMGALTGGALGGTLGAFSKMPVTAPSKVAAAADRSGVYVPEALASDNPAIQQAGGAAKSIPVFGTRITEAGKRTVSEFTGEKARIADEFGGGAAAGPQSAGQDARDALEEWIGPVTQGVLKQKYGAVDALVNPAAKTTLGNTLFESAAITAKNKASGLPPGGAVKFVKDALAMPGGQTYQGIKNLRTHVGEMLKDPTSLAHKDIAEQELERIYGSLTKDLRKATENAGGPGARAAFDEANALNAKVETRRKELRQLLGIKTPASPEAVFAAIHRKARSGSMADIGTLNKIRKSMPPDTWDQIASGVVGELGRSDAMGTVSLDKFFTHWNQLSDAGKTALFGNKPALRSALDDLAIIAGRGKEVSKWANPSGTAQHGAYIAAGAALANPALWPKILTSAIGAHLLTKALTRPATVRAMTAWARVLNAHQVNRLGGGGPAQKNVNALQFVSRRFAAEIGHQFGLGADRVNQLALQLAGETPPPATAEEHQ